MGVCGGLRLALLSLACCTLVGCGHRQSPAAQETAVILFVQEPANFNPILAADSYENFVDALLFDGLTTMDAHGKVIPDLATRVPSVANHDVSPDGKTITFHLRHNVRWQDGTPFTSKDVSFTWSAIMNPRNDVGSRHGYDQVTSVDTPDDFTVVFRLHKPFAPAVTALFGEGAQPLRILPSHRLGQASDLNETPFNNAPVGTGAYRFVQRHSGTDIVLRANPGYFRGRPHIEALRIEIIPNDETAATLMRTREADLAILGSPQIFNSLRNVPQVKLYDPPVPSFETIEINNAKLMLSDPRVRKAIAMAIDRERIELTVEHGESRLATGPITPEFSVYAKDVDRYQYDPRKARALLESSGWHLGSDGIRHRAGAPLSLTFAYGAGSPSAQNLAVQVQSMLRAVGIDLTLKPYAFELLYAPYAGGGIFAKGDYDIGLYDTTTGPDPDDAISMFECSQVPPAGINFARYCSKQVDADARDGMQTLNEADRARFYSDAQRVLSRDEPVVFLFWLKDVYESSARFQGFAPNPFTESWNAYEWHIGGA